MFHGLINAHSTIYWCSSYRTSTRCPSWVNCHTSIYMKNYIFELKGCNRVPDRFASNFGALAYVEHHKIQCGPFGITQFTCTSKAGKSRFPGFSDMCFECVTSLVYVWYDIMHSNAVQTFADFKPEKWALVVCLYYVIMISHSHVQVQVMMGCLS